MPVEALIIKFGLVIVFFGVMVEGETILVLGAYLAHRGYLSLPEVIIAAFAGTFIADQIFFWLGHSKGEALLKRLPGLRPAVDRAGTLVERYNLILALGFRFVFGLRSVTPFVLGMTGFRAALFLPLNLIGGAVWSMVLGMAGYAFGHALELLLSDIRRYEMRVAAAILIAGTGFAIFRWLTGNRADRRPAG